MMVPNVLGKRQRSKRRSGPVPPMLESLREPSLHELSELRCYFELRNRLQVPEILLCRKEIILSEPVIWVFFYGSYINRSDRDTCSQIRLPRLVRSKDREFSAINRNRLAW